MCTCVKRWLNAQEETLALSGTLRYLGSSCKTKAPPRRYPAERQYASSGSPSAFFGQQTPLWCNQGSVIEAQSSEHRRKAAVEEMYLHVCSLCTAICMYVGLHCSCREEHTYVQYVRICIHMYVCMCVCMYVCVCMYPSVYIMCSRVCICMCSSVYVMYCRVCIMYVP